MAATTSALAGVVVVVIVLLAARVGAGLKCYSCFTSNKVSQNCGDPFSLRVQHDMVDCDKVPHNNYSGSPFCKKIKQLEDRSPTVTRLCAWSQNESTACNSDTLPPGTEHLQLLHCSACNTDGCNPAAALLPTVVLFAAMLLLLFFRGA